MKTILTFLHSINPKAPFPALNPKPLLLSETPEIKAPSAATSLPPSSSKTKLFMIWVGLHLITASITTGIANALIYANTCLEDYMPHSLCQIIGKHNDLHDLARRVLFPKSIFLQLTVGASILEELQYRLLIQEILLRRIPKAILSKISPNRVSLVESKTAKIARVMISSTLFALVHYVPYDCNRIIDPFGVGIMTGSLQEIKGNTVYPIILHSFNNLIPCLINEASRHN